MPLATVDTVKLGEKIVVIGYPGISQDVIEKRTMTSEPGNFHTEWSVIHEPTVTDGIIANLGLSSQSVTEGDLIGNRGDIYQLTVLATGHGNSGGPVIDGQGKVVALFTYGFSNNGERVTSAVPIKYARQFFKQQ